jgi:hypothetical protein
MEPYTCGIWCYLLKVIRIEPRASCMLDKHWPLNYTQFQTSIELRGHPAGVLSRTPSHMWYQQWSVSWEYNGRNRVSVCFFCSRGNKASHLTSWESLFLICKMMTSWGLNKIVQLKPRLQSLPEWEFNKLSLCDLCWLIDITRMKRGKEAISYPVSIGFLTLF